MKKDDKSIKKIDHKKYRPDKPPQDPSLPLSNEKWERFVQNYIVSLDPRKSAIEAGYTPGGAYRGGLKLLNIPEIRERLRFFKDEINHDAIVSAERVIREYTKLAFTDISDVLDVKNGCVIIKDLSEIPVECRAAVKEISDTGGGRIKVSFHNKIKALDSLAKYLGLFQDNNIHIHTAPETEFIVEFVESSARIDPEEIIEGKVIE